MKWLNAKLLLGFIVANIILFIVLVGVIYYTVSRINRVDSPEELQPNTGTKEHPEVIYRWKDAEGKEHYDYHYYKK